MYALAYGIFVLRAIRFASLRIKPSDESLLINVFLLIRFNLNVAENDGLLSKQIELCKSHSDSLSNVISAFVRSSNRIGFLPSPTNAIIWLHSLNLIGKQFTPFLNTMLRKYPQVQPNTPALHHRLSRTEYHQAGRLFCTAPSRSHQGGDMEPAVRTLVMRRGFSNHHITILVKVPNGTAVFTFVSHFTSFLSILSSSSLIRL